MKSRRLVLVTGCARSGTLFMSKVLQSLGLKVGHEYVDDHGTASHFFAAKCKLDYPVISSKHPKGRCIHVNEQREDFVFDHVFHQIRNPLKTISSLRWTGVRADHMRAATQLDVKKAVSAHRALVYWVEWNLLAEAQATRQYRIEDIDKVFPELASSLGLGAVPLPDIPKDTHTERRWEQPYSVISTDPKTGEKSPFVPTSVRKRVVEATPELTWADLEKIDPEYTKRAKQLAEKYGYDV